MIRVQQTCAFLQFLADEVVARGAVSVVPHEGVRESLGGGGQAGVVVQPPQLHAVLLAEEVVVWLLQHVVVLTPAGEPVCNQTPRSETFRNENTILKKK